MPQGNDYKLISDKQLEGAIQKGVENAFTKAGIDISNPFETQQDFAHLRKQRENAEDSSKQVRNIIIKKTSEIGFIGLVLAFYTWVTGGVGGH